MRSPFPYVILVASSFLLSSFQVKENTGANTPTPPNVIFILADDLGYGDLGFLGQQHILTPALDRLASQGMRFSQH